jgi:hypothetical protein
MALQTARQADDEEGISLRDLEAMADVRREALARDLESAEPCASLWLAVILRALQDLAFLRQKAGKEQLKPHERKRIERIREYDPAAFFLDPWFREICDHIGVSADAVRPGGLSGTPPPA